MSAYGVAKVEPQGGGVLEIHKPKPWHGLREFLKDYLIIVVGVLTALAAETAPSTLSTLSASLVSRGCPLLGGEVFLRGR
jgi:hypothetical protein